MVVDNESSEHASVDRLFHALSDGTRRDILHRSVEGGLSVSRLAEYYPMSSAAVQKHVTVLERAGLVSKERHGREQLVRLEPDAVHRARAAPDRIEGFGEEPGEPGGMPSVTIRWEISEHGDGARMVLRSTFTSVEAMEQMIEMGMDEGMSAAIGQIDKLLAA
ncbi:metalloregulator ArsR/SmtB family transcription factor [Nocardiopsis oceani]